MVRLQLYFGITFNIMELDNKPKKLYCNLLYDTFVFSDCLNKCSWNGLSERITKLVGYEVQETNFKSRKLYCR